MYVPCMPLNFLIVLIAFSDCITVLLKKENSLPLLYMYIFSLLYICSWKLFLFRCKFFFSNLCGYMNLKLLYILFSIYVLTMLSQTSLDHGATLSRTTGQHQCTSLRIVDVTFPSTLIWSYFYTLNLSGGAFLYTCTNWRLALFLMSFFCAN